MILLIQPQFVITKCDSPLTLYITLIFRASGYNFFNISKSCFSVNPNFLCLVYKYSYNGLLVSLFIGIGIVLTIF